MIGRKVVRSRRLHVELLEGRLLLSAGNPNPGVLPPNAKAFGKTYAEWGDTWWNWAVDGPSATNPVLDPTGANCHVGQQGKVWFLAGTFGGEADRSCTIPTGKAIFFPIVNFVFWNPEDGSTEAAVRALANANADAISVLQAEVDGVALDNLFDYRAESGPGGFTLNIEPDSPVADFGYAPGPRDPAVADGYWVMLAPLSAGAHELHFAAIAGDPNAPLFEVDITYHLTVVGGKRRADPVAAAVSPASSTRPSPSSQASARGDLLSVTIDSGINRFNDPHPFPETAEAASLENGGHEHRPGPRNFAFEVSTSVYDLEAQNASL